MKVLIISYEFPPLNVGGSQRPLKFVKYLPDYNIEPIILTLDPDDYEKVYRKPIIDNSLTKDLSSSLIINYVRSKNLLLKRRNTFISYSSIVFNIYRGSEGKYWKNDFKLKAAQIINNNDIKVIFVTAPPFSVLPLAKELSLKYRLPLVIDMRDAWTLWGTAPYSNYFTYLFTKLKEREIFKFADKVIVTSEQTISDFKFLHQNIREDKFVYIPNGYDESFEINESVFEPKNKIKIGYAGSFYYSPEGRDAILKPFWKKRWHRVLQFSPRKEDWLYRSPYFFFKTIRKVLDLNPILSNNIEIHFAGNKPDWLDNMIRHFKLEEIFKHHGFLNYDKIRLFEESCDLLLVTSSKVIGGRDYSIAGKTFEYMTKNKPILAFVSDGAQKDLLEKSGLAIICNSDETEANTKRLIHIFNNGLKLDANKDFILDFHRKKLTEKLANILADLGNK